MAQSLSTWSSLHFLFLYLSIWRACQWLPHLCVGGDGGWGGHLVTVTPDDSNKPPCAGCFFHLGQRSSIDMILMGWWLQEPHTSENMCANTIALFALWYCELFHNIVNYLGFGTYISRFFISQALLTEKFTLKVIQRFSPFIPRYSVNFYCGTWIIMLFILIVFANHVKCMFVNRFGWMGLKMS